MKKYPVIVSTVYGHKVVLCKSYKRAVQVMTDERYSPSAFAWVQTGVLSPANTKRLRVKVRLPQQDRVAMVRETPRGPVVTLYRDGYQLAAELARPETINRRYGALVFDDVPSKKAGRR